MINPMKISLWQRSEQGSTGRPADVVLIAFHRGALADEVPLAAARFGLPGRAHAELCDIRAHAGADAPEWLDGFRQGALRTIAERQLDAAGLARLDAADACVTVRATVLDPFDLGYLQAAWGIARWLCARGAGVVLDARATRFWSGARVAEVAADAAFDVRREISLIAETDATAGLGGHVVHTRGLLKLARPDLVTVVAREDVDAAADVLWRLAAREAAGYMPASGDRVSAGADADVPLLLTLAPPGSFVEALALDNDAFLVAGADGAAPEWAAARARRQRD
jgi:hypothetical protein